jgi:hypothetical protein
LCISSGCEENAGRHRAPQNDTHIVILPCAPLERFFRAFDILTVRSEINRHSLDVSRWDRRAELDLGPTSAFL